MDDYRPYGGRKSTISWTNFIHIWQRSRRAFWQQNASRSVLLSPANFLRLLGTANPDAM